jgi:cysteinyl-tRNA synthetase
MLRIYNTLTRNKEVFEPIVPGKVTLYVCGSTVYDFCHIGHGRSIMVVFDMVTRYLRALGYQVKYVRNITDIDDKIINRAHELGEDFNHLTERFIAAMHEDQQALGVSSPDVEPRATQHIPAIIAMIEKLLTKGYAYVTESGDVFYAVSCFADYGQFSNQSIEKLRSGARVDILDIKKDPLDFALWKLAKPGEPSWDSPWGKGRPGWHIECSAMSTECLGEHIDIHGGGLDLVFPHHQNEIAQSEGAYGGRFVNYWMHVGFVQVDREKMSKSLGNFLTIRDVLAQYNPEVVRYFMLASHYRSPINYSHANLESAQMALSRLYLCLRGLPLSEPLVEENEFSQRFHEAMDDDFNTPLAFAALFDLSRKINRLRDSGDMQTGARLGALLRNLSAILGIGQQEPEEFLRLGIANEEIQKIEQLIAARNKARNTKQWVKADELRDLLLAMGIVIEDTAEGTVWRK